MNVPLRLGARDPAVLQGGLAGQPVLHVDAHQGPDEVLGLLADVVPVGGVKLKLSCEIVSIRFPAEESVVTRPPPGTAATKLSRQSFSRRLRRIIDHGNSAHLTVPTYL